MAPRITFHSSASSNSNGRTWPAPEQHNTNANANGKNVEMDIDEDEDLSEIDEPSPQEVDELDESDSGSREAQPQWETISSTSTPAFANAASAKAGAKRQRAKPPTSRIPGQTIVPMSRVEAIVQADVAQNGTPSKEASYIISLATEEFIRRLTRVAHSRSRVDKRPLTTYNDFADSAYYFDEYKFLQEIMPRPLSPKTALAEHQRVLEQHDALLNGLDANGVDIDTMNKYKNEQASGSASTSKASTPIPRLSKAKDPANASTNRKTSSKAKNTTVITTAPVVRSERQRNKKARLSYESQASGELSTTANMGPPASSARNGHGPGDSVVANGSTSSSTGGSVKIKIRPRMASAASTAVPLNAAPSPPILPLGPQAEPSSAGAPEHEVLKRSRWRPQQRNAEDSDAPILFEEDTKSGAANDGANGKGGSVQFAPVGVDATDQPLWTRVPLPPPPSAKVTKTHTEYEDTRNGSMVTDLDSVVEQARVSRVQKSAKSRSGPEREGSAPSFPHESKPAENGSGPELAAPPAKKSRQRQRSGDSFSMKGKANGETVANAAPGKGGLRDALNGTLPNPGRTIYSQR